MNLNADCLPFSTIYSSKAKLAPISMLMGKSESVGPDFNKRR